jgi:N-methylhydantoinase A
MIDLPSHPHTAVVGVDIGGTFTDFVYLSPDGIRIFKLLSTKADPSTAFLDGLAALQVDAGALVAHGTTVATNAVLEHQGARTSLIVTEGFRDLLAIGRQTRPQLYHLAFAPRWLPVPEDLTAEVSERVAPDGRALTPLDPAEAAQTVAALAQAGAESLAVCLLFAFANPAHEQIIQKLAEGRGLFVSLSSDILPEYREFERASTTVLNAYVSPILGRYLANLEAGLQRRGHRSLWIMQSSGGILSAAAARREAVRSLLSGPAAGVTGAFYIGQLAGYDHLITFDMGGTSTDVSLADGAIRRTAEGSVEGWPARIPMIDIHTVGAGGGSIAWVDAGGALRVGPESAGSEPGPACYGRGATPETLPFTVTDANLLLGRLAADHFLGGRMALDRAAAEAAAAPLAQRLNLTPLELAEGVIRVVNARMEQAIRVISIERGFDPRQFTLLPFGGAGPMHALEMAEALHIGRVLAPRYPGVLSALGLALADFVKDYSRTLMWILDDVNATDLAAAFVPLLSQGRRDLSQEGFGPEEIGFEQALDLRYRGQSFELTIPIDSCDPQAAASRFFVAHQQRYGYARQGEPLELVNLRLTARGRRPRPDLRVDQAAAAPDPAAARIGTTDLRLAGRPWPAPVHERASLLPGHELRGPALVVQEDATTVLLPGWVGRVDAWLNLILVKNDV